MEIVCVCVFHWQVTTSLFVPLYNPQESDRKCLNHAHAQSFDRCGVATRSRPKRDEEKREPGN